MSLGTIKTDMKAWSTNVDSEAIKGCGTTVQKSILTQVQGPVLPAEGSPIICGKDVSGSKGVGAIYRVEDGKLKWYPNPDIASSWDPNWNKFTTVPDCSSLSLGSDMTNKNSL
jgi:hypothetical protein